MKIHRAEEPQLARDDRGIIYRVPCYCGFNGQWEEFLSVAEIKQSLHAEDSVGN